MTDAERRAFYHGFVAACGLTDGGASHQELLVATAVMREGWGIPNPDPHACEAWLAELISVGAIVRKGRLN